MNHQNYIDDNQRPSPSSSSSSSSSSAAAGKQSRRLQRHMVEEDAGDSEAASRGSSCQSCTAGAIADCVAVCCCPCAVVNFLALALIKLPWAVARRCIGGHRKKNRRRRLEEKRKCYGGVRDGISGNGMAVEGTTSDIVLSGAVIGEELNVSFSAEFRADDVWLELYVGHLGFGRISFTGVPFQNKGN